ncbi:NLI interacting factor [Lasiodiplodia theobromae]|nr:NLI interacting factor [Lasiodiplodia theobromae]
MENSTLIPIARYCTFTTTSSTFSPAPHPTPHHQNPRDYFSDTDKNSDAQMGKKKSKKLNQQQQQQQQQPTATADGLAPLPLPTTQSIASTPQALPSLTSAPNNADPAAQHDDAAAADGDGQSKKSKKKQRARERREAKKQQLFLRKQQQQPALEQKEGGFGAQAQQPSFTAEGFDDPDGGVGLRSGDEPPRDFVGQPLLDALDEALQGGSEAETARAGGGGTGRRASLARRPAQQGGSADGPPPGAPTQPRAARNAAEPPLGAPTGPKSMAQAQQPRAPKSYAHPPQYWQTPGVSAAEVGSQAPSQAAFASYSQAAPSDDNPHGYNVQNATWDWNNPFGGMAADSAEAGGLNGGGSNAYTSDYQTDAGSAPWPGTYGDYWQQQQSSSPQPFGQVPSVYDAYLHQPMNINYQTGYYPSYQGSGDGGMRYIHGHTNSFAAPFTPTASVQQYYQGHSWHVDKPYSASTTRGFSTTAAAQKKHPQPPHPSQRRWNENTSYEEGGVPVSTTPKHYTNAMASIQAQKDALQDRPQPPWKRTSKSPSPGSRWSGRGGKGGRQPTKPKPTREYLTVAENEPTRLAAPRPLLVVIDLNGTLVHRPQRNKSSRVIRRPYVTAFLDYLLANHRVMVWSSARPENVGRMCAQLFAPTDRARLAAEWGRDTLDLTPQQYMEKVQVYKKLSKVWQQAETSKWHPLHSRTRSARNDDYSSQRFGQHNTLLIDDSVLKASSEPHNLVRVEEFEGRPHQMQTDVLRQVVAYLEEAKWMADVSAWNRAGNAFVADDPRWQWYSWPEGTLPETIPDGIVVPGDEAAGGAAGSGFEEWKENYRRAQEEKAAAAAQREGGGGGVGGRGLSAMEMWRRDGPVDSLD